MQPKLELLECKFLGVQRGATEIEAVGVYIFRCSGEVQPKLELLGCIFLAAQRGATEIGAVGVYIFGCSGGVHSKLELLECICLGAQVGCTRNWSCWSVYFWVPRRGALEIGGVGVYSFGCSGGGESKLAWLVCFFLGA